MSQIQSIYLIADPEKPHSPAFERARALALATQARVHVAAFCYSRAIAAVGAVNREGMEGARDGLVEATRRAVEQQAIYLRDLGLEVSHGATWAHPILPEIMAELAELKPDLVILDAHDRSLPQRLLATSLDQQILRHVNIPVMLVEHDDPPQPRRILAAVDVMAGDEALGLRLLRQASALALQCGAELHLSYVAEPVVVVGSDMMVGEFSGQIYAEDVDRLRRQAFRDFVVGQHIPPDLVHYLEGTVGPTLGSFAAANRFDLIVIASSGRGWFDRWLLGSTAEHMALHGPCGLLVLPAEAKY